MLSKIEKLFIINCMMSKNILKKNRDKILSICKKYGAKDIRIFGSLARGDSNKKSDVDILVKMEAGRTLFDLVDLWQELEEVLNCKVDIITEGGVSPYLREKIFSEAIPL